jgi:hypothetical protein
MKRRLIGAVKEKRPEGLFSSDYIHEDTPRDELDEFDRVDLPRPPWLAFPPLDAMRRCVSLSIAANPLLLEPRAIGQFF